MPQSLVKNYLHITFSTKHRQPFIDDQIEEELYDYLGGICKNHACNPMQVGGHRNHVHILCMLSRKIALMNLIEELKTGTSKWIKTRGERYHLFFWQRGYGAFSVNPEQTNSVINYIKNQKDHHKNQNFKEEYLSFLKSYNIDYDERYVWD